jgi:hypothetical protein
MKAAFIEALDPPDPIQYGDFEKPVAITVNPRCGGAEVDWNGESSRRQTRSFCVSGEQPPIALVRLGLLGIVTSPNLPLQGPLLTQDWL